MALGSTVKTALTIILKSFSKTLLPGSVELMQRIDMRKLGKMFSQLKMSLILLEIGRHKCSKANFHTPSATFFCYGSRSGIWPELRLLN